MMRTKRILPKKNMRTISTTTSQKKILMNSMKLRMKKILKRISRKRTLRKRTLRKTTLRRMKKISILTAFLPRKNR